MNLYHKLKLGKPVFVSDISGVCFVRQTKNSDSSILLFTVIPWRMKTTQLISVRSKSNDLFDNEKLCFMNFPRIIKIWY